MTERCTTGRFASIPLLSSGRAGRRHSITRKLGNMPDVALRSMRDYGLSDLDIARYYGLTLASVRRLSQLFSVAPGRPDSGCWIGRHKVARQAPSAAAQDRTYEVDTNTRNDPCKTASIGEIASATEMNTAFRRIPQQRHPFIIPDDPTASERVGDVFADNGFLTEPRKRKYHNCGDASEALAAFFQRQSGPETVHAFDERDCHDHYTLEMPFLTAAKGRRMRKPDTRGGQQRNGCRHADVRPMRRHKASPTEIMLLLPKLRFAARVMTGSAERGDHLVAQTLKRAIAEAARKPWEVPLLDWLNGIMDEYLASRIYPDDIRWICRLH